MMRRLLLLLSVIAPCVGAQTPSVFDSRVVPFQNNAFATSLNFLLPNPNGAQAGNAIIFACYWNDQTITTTATDENSQTYTNVKGIVNGTDNTAMNLFVSLNVASGTRRPKVTYSAGAANQSCAAFEANNIATSSATDITASRVTSGTTLSSGSMTTTSDGDLIVHCVRIANPGSHTTNPSYTADTGFTLLVPDGPGFFVCEWGVQTTHGAINPTITSSFSVAANGADSVTIALKKASSGGLPPAGIYLKSLQTYNVPGNLNAPSQTSYTFQFPCSGTNVFMAVQINGIAGFSTPVSSVTNSPSTTWSHTTFTASSSGNETTQWYYSQLGSGSDTQTFTINFSSAQGNIRPAAFCVTGADNSAAFDTSTTATGTSSATSGNINGAVISPSTSNGLVLSFIEEDGETVTSTSPGAVEVADFGVYSNASGDTDQGLAAYYNPNTSSITNVFTFSNYESGTQINTWISSALAIKAAPSAATPSITKARKLEKLEQ
jgi:hypothetical protein